jgi:CheY-like chemotaxis protein
MLSKLHGSGEHALINTSDHDRDERMQEWVSGIVQAVLAVRNAGSTFPLRATTFLAFGFNALQVMASKNVVSNLGLTLSILAVLYNFYESRKSRKERDLAQRLSDSLHLREADRKIIAGLQEDNKLAAAQREKLEFEVAQISAELLRERGILAHSGRREPLRPTVPLTAVEVLIVEDEHSIRRALAKILAHYGFRVSESDTVAEALVVIRGRQRVGPRFDFVVLDLQLPDGSGIDVLQMIHAGRPGTAGTHVIISSGTLDQDLLEDARRYGASAILVKPIDLRELLALLGCTEDDIAQADSGSNPIVNHDV